MSILTGLTHRLDGRDTAPIEPLVAIDSEDGREK
jgi:hypothetical protein